LKISEIKSLFKMKQAVREVQRNADCMRSASNLDGKAHPACLPGGRSALQSTNPGGAPAQGLEVSRQRLSTSRHPCCTP